MMTRSKEFKKIKDELQTGSCIRRTVDTNICALHNLADPVKCPHDVPPNFKDGDEIGCRADSEEATPTEEICVQALPDADKLVATCSTSTQGFPATPLPDGAFAWTNFCFCGVGGEKPKIRAKREEDAVQNGAPQPTPAPMLS